MRNRFSSRVVAVFTALGPAAPGLHIVAAKGEAPAEIQLYDEIGPWGVTAAAFTRALADAGPGPVKVRINSPGGDVFDGLAIFNALKQRGGVEIVVDGLAASAASYVAMAGETVTMAEQSMLMIHNSWTLAVGNRHDFTKTAGTMEKIDAQMAEIYAARTGKDGAEIAAMLDAETWLTAAEAKDAGFCDAVLAAPKRDKSALTALGGPADAIETEDDAADAPGGAAAAHAARNRRLRLAESELS